VVGWIVLPPLFDQAGRFAERVPEYVDRIESLRRDYDELSARYPALGTFDEEVAGLAERFGSAFGARLVNLPMTTATLLFQLLTIIALSTLMVMRRERIVGAVLPLVAPRHRPRVIDVYEKVWDRVGAYVRAKIIVMVVIGGLMYLCLLALDVPFAVPLSVIVAFGEVIPQIGPWIGRIPLLGVAALEGLTTMGLVFLASFVLENLKAYVIGPRVEGEQLNIDPLVVLIAVLAGATLFGPAGALVSVPFAAMLQLLYEEIVLPWRAADIAEEEPIGPPAPEKSVHTSTLDL
jgi:predicted PurR-regulated permease PerM